MGVVQSGPTGMDDITRKLLKDLQIHFQNGMQQRTAYCAQADFEIIIILIRNDKNNIISFSSSLDIENFSEKFSIHYNFEQLITTHLSIYAFIISY